MDGIPEREGNPCSFLQKILARTVFNRFRSMEKYGVIFHVFRRSAYSQGNIGTRTGLPTMIVTKGAFGDIGQA
jgi:hypothetical protein